MNKKVLLIAPYFENSEYPTYLPSENLGIGYIAAFLRKNNIEVDILDANMQSIKSENILEHIELDNYFLIGISSSFQQLLAESVVIAKKIKNVNKNIHVTIGGHFPTFQHYNILKNYDCFDSVSRGDGEYSITELALKLKNNCYFLDVEGMSFLNNSQIIVNNDRPLVNLDILPWPARDTLTYIKNHNHNWATQLTTSRGCYGNCLFCDIRSFYNGCWRARDYIDVVDEIEYLINTYGCNTFRFTDDEFLGPFPKGPERAKRFAQEIIKRNIKANFMISARAEDVNEELFSLLAQAGVNDCLIGVESGVDRLLRMYNKKTTVEQNQKCIDILKKIGINLNLAYIMIDPRMTFDELKQNYEFIKKNGIVTIDSLRSHFWPLYGTPALRQFENENLIKSQTISKVEYYFIDKNVEFVFNKINELCKECFELDKKIQKSIMLGFDKAILNEVNNEYLNYWINYFESLLYGIEFDKQNNFFDQSIKKLEKRI